MILLLGSVDNHIGENLSPSRNTPSTNLPSTVVEEGSIICFHPLYSSGTEQTTYGPHAGKYTGIGSRCCYGNTGCCALRCPAVLSDSNDIAGR